MQQVVPDEMGLKHVEWERFELLGAWAEGADVDFCKPTNPIAFPCESGQCGHLRLVCAFAVSQW